METENLKLITREALIPDLNNGSCVAYVRVEEAATNGEYLFKVVVRNKNQEYFKLVNYKLKERAFRGNGLFKFHVGLFGEDCPFIVTFDGEPYHWHSRKR